MKFMREHRPPSKKPPVWDIVSLLYEQEHEGEDETLKMKRSKHSIAKVARHCKSSWSDVKRIKVAIEERGLEGVKELRWGGGAPSTPAPPVEEIEWLTAPSTLQLQAHMSMAERAAAFNQLFDRELKEHHIRQLYRYQRISKQKFRARPGPPKPTEKALAKQEQYIDKAKAEVERLSKLGYDILQYDASIFSPDSFVPSAWAPMKQPP